MQRNNINDPLCVLRKLLKMSAAVLAAMLVAVVGLSVKAEAKTKVEKVVLSSVKNTDSGKVSVKYKKTPGAKGYQIQYSTDKKFKKGVKSKTTAKTTYQLSGLVPGTKYYVHVCAYVTKSGKKVYGSWSGTKAVTVKPAKAAISSAAYSGGKVTVKVKAVKKVKGYQYQFARDKKCQSLIASKKTTAKSYSQKVDSSLSRCYVRVRAYASKAGKTTYGPWSAVKEIKVAQGADKPPTEPGGLYSIQGPDRAKVYTGGEVELSIAANGSANRNPRTKWRVADADIASIYFSYGLGAIINGKKAGTTTVTAAIGDQTLSWRITVVQPVSRYSYEIKVLNDSKHLYTDTDFFGRLNWVIFFIKTENPDKASLKMTGAFDYGVSTHFDDIRYTTNAFTGQFDSAVGGYIYIMSYTTPGEKEFTVQEKLEDGRYYDMATKKVIIEDNDAAAEKWFVETLNKVTNDSMSKIEKIYALKDFIKSDFKYYARDINGKSLTLTTQIGAFWESKVISCTSATGIIEHFADLIGLSWRDEHSGSHVAAVVIDEDGVEHYIDAQPPDTNILTGITYKN